MRAAALKKALAAGQHAAVVGVVEDDGVVGQAILLKLLQPGGDLFIHQRHVVVIPGPICPHLRGVRLVRGDAHLGGVRGCEIQLKLFDGEQAALVGDFVVEHAEERLLRVGPFAPVGIPARGVPRLLHVDGRVVVRLGVVGGVIAGLAQIGGKALKPGGDLALCPHVLGWTAGDRVHAGDEREPRGSANRLGETALEQDALAGQTIQRRGARQRIAVATEESAVVLADQPEDVGPFSGALGCRSGSPAWQCCQYQQTVEDEYQPDPGGIQPDDCAEGKLLSHRVHNTAAQNDGRGYAVLKWTASQARTVASRGSRVGLGCTQCRNPASPARHSLRPPRISQHGSKPATRRRGSRRITSGTELLRRTYGEHTVVIRR